MLWKLRGELRDLSKRGMVMGILNVTPDSFSDGGSHFAHHEAVRVALQMVEEGAEIIDVGGESTRPGAKAVGLEEEIQRTIPVIESLRQKSDVLISIDTSKAEVARIAIESGADVVNDVTGLRREREMVKVCASAGCAVVVMHMQGEPETMQNAPTYSNVGHEVKEFFEERMTTLVNQGIEKESICLDPGIGFGKSFKHNKQLLNEVASLRVGSRPLMIGASRKSVVGDLLGEAEPGERDWGTVAVTSLTRRNGAEIHRVHDVRKNVHAMRMMEAICFS